MGGEGRIGLGAEHKRLAAQGLGRVSAGQRDPQVGAVVAVGTADSARGRGKSNDTEFNFTKLCSRPGLMVLAAAAAAKSLQSCPTLCNPIDSSPPGSPVPGILQARTLEWVAISFSKA